MKTVFHLSSGKASDQSELLGNIQNLLDDETVEVSEIAAVVNANAIDMVKKDSEASKFITGFPDKVQFYSCSNSLENRNISPEDMLEGVETATSGVGKLNQLQDRGFNYIKI